MQDGAPKQKVFTTTKLLEYAQYSTTTLILRPVSVKNWPNSELNYTVNKSVSWQKTLGTGQSTDTFQHSNRCVSTVLVLSIVRTILKWNAVKTFLHHYCWTHKHIHSHYIHVDVQLTVNINGRVSLVKSSLGEMYGTSRRDHGCIWPAEDGWRE